MADAYSYIKMSNAYPSAGGIAMILDKAYGPTTVAAGASLLMALSMVINESLVARTFGTYTLRAFGGDNDSVLVPVLGVGLIVLGYLVTASGTRSVGLVSIVMAVLKVGGIALSRMLGAADGRRARRRGVGRLRCDEVAIRPSDRGARPHRHGAGVPVRAGVPRAQSGQ